MAIPSSSFATHYDWLIMGDSICAGATGDSCCSLPTGCINALFGCTSGNQDHQAAKVMVNTLNNGDTFYNACCIGWSAPMNVVTEVADNFFGTYTPTKFLEHDGINDINTGVSIQAYLDARTTMLAIATSAGVTTFITDQILPNNSAEGFIQNVKIYNAWLENWAVQHQVKMAPSYQDMNDPTTDGALNATYQYDATHPNWAGHQVMGYLWAFPAIPSKNRDWGSASYPTFGHESLSWWVPYYGASISGGTTDTVTGYLNGGTLIIPNGGSVVSDVIAIMPTHNKIIISGTVTQGTPVYQYRRSASDFTRGSAGDWTTYTGPFSPITPGTVEFIQIGISNVSATELHVTVPKLDWNGVAMWASAKQGSGYATTKTGSGYASVKTN